MIRKSFSRELAKLNQGSEDAGFERVCLNSLYGRLKIPGSEYVLLHSPVKGSEYLHPYLVCTDERNAGEIWNIIGHYVEKRAMEMLENETIRHPWNEDVDYVGKMEECTVIIAKELVLPEAFKKLEAAESNAAKPCTTEDYILSGKLFDDLEEDNLRYQELIKILKEEGMSISNRTLIDISMSPGGYKSQHSIELMNLAEEVLGNYKVEILPSLWYGLNYDGSGSAVADIHTFGEGEPVFLGEAKVIEPLLPCSRTYSQVSREWKKKRRKNQDEVPCGFIEGQDHCAPGWCKTASRGTYEKAWEKRPEKHPDMVKNVSQVVKDVFGAMDSRNEALEEHL